MVFLDYNLFSYTINLFLFKSLCVSVKYVNHSCTSDPGQAEQCQLVTMPAPYTPICLSKSLFSPFSLNVTLS